MARVDGGAQVASEGCPLERLGASGRVDRCRIGAGCIGRGMVPDQRGGNHRCSKEAHSAHALVQRLERAYSAVSLPVVHRGASGQRP